jgi:hypothetical protein
MEEEKHSKQEKQACRRWHCEKLFLLFGKVNLGQNNKNVTEKRTYFSYF